jgi:hypothetical protein
MSLVLRTGDSGAMRSLKKFISVYVSHPDSASNNLLPPAGMNA